jgi:hypothetical protein
VIALTVGYLDELANDELERELTIAASAPGRLRFARFEELLAEAKRRRECPATRTTPLSTGERVAIPTRPWAGQR